MQGKISQDIGRGAADGDMRHYKLGSGVSDGEGHTKRRAAEFIGAEVLRRVESENQKEECGAAFQEEDSRSHGAHQPRRQDQEGE